MLKIPPNFSPKMIYIPNNNIILRNGGESFKQNSRYRTMEMKFKLAISILLAMTILTVVSAGEDDCAESKIILRQFHLDSDKSPWSEFLDEDTTITYFIPRIVVLANSIDFALAPDFIEFLKNRGFVVVLTSPADFDSCKEMELIVILGGPDAPEGVGEIVIEALNYCEEKAIRQPGARKMYLKNNLWAPNQKVAVIAGSNREMTKLAHQENRALQSIESDAANTMSEEECLGVDCGSRFHLTCNAIYNSDHIRKTEVLIRASESEWQDYRTYVETIKSGNPKTIEFEKALWKDIERLRRSSEGRRI
jgi:hypothetical protein